MKIFGGLLPFLGFKTFDWTPCDCDTGCGLEYRYKGLTFEWLNYGYFIYGEIEIREAEPF